MTEFALALQLAFSQYYYSPTYSDHEVVLLLRPEVEVTKIGEGEAVYKGGER